MNAAELTVPGFIHGHETSNVMVVAIAAFANMRANKVDKSGCGQNYTHVIILFYIGERKQLNV